MISGPSLYILRPKRHTSEELFNCDKKDYWRCYKNANQAQVKKSNIKYNLRNYVINILKV
jgi:hypothetical protein